MSFEVLSLFLDIAVLLALGTGVYFALKITRVLDNFKKARKEMKGMIQTLTEQINLAEKSIESLKYESYETADELRSLIKKAAPLAGELKVMSEAGGHIADRLEELGERGAASEAVKEKPIDWASESQGVKNETDDIFEEDGAFAIQDHDYETEESDLESEAERELFKVLKGAGGA